MDLVGYSDSEDSADEKPVVASSKAAPTPSSNSTFAVDRSNPRKIKVNLQEIEEDASENNEGPAPKRQRTGGGLGAFNAMLPAPKRDPSNDISKPTTNKVPKKLFSLKTGAEPGFSRESDAELRQMFAEQDAEQKGGPTSNGLPVTSGSDETIKNPTQPAKAPEGITKPGAAFTFKPLSVARNSQKKKKPANASKALSTPTSSAQTPVPAASAPKINLFSFSSNDSSTPLIPDPSSENPLQDSTFAPTGLTDDPFDQPLETTYPDTTPDPSLEPSQTLSSVATDLNLPPSARRQLLGRTHKNISTTTDAPKILTFNTDAEYTRNSALLSSGALAAPHNPVRAIAPGRHSLKQLLGSASGQLEALEESFAEGRRNKREAGSKYGW